MEIYAYDDGKPFRPGDPNRIYEISSPFAETGSKVISVGKDVMESIRMDSSRFDASTLKGLAVYL